MPTASALDTPVLPRRPSSSSSGNLYPTYKRFERFPASRIVGEMTVEEWFVFLQTATQKHEYVHGKVVLVPGGSGEHPLICTDISTAFSTACQAAGSGCDAINSDIKIYVSDDLYYFADVTIVCGNLQLDFTDGLRNPVALFEVLSPSTETDDRTDKFRDYQTIDTLRHYVLVEQHRPFITHYAKQENGLWVVAAMLTSLDQILTLDLNGQNVSVPLTQIYRRVSFDGPSEEN